MGECFTLIAATSSLCDKHKGSSQVFTTIVPLNSSKICKLKKTFYVSWQIYSTKEINFDKVRSIDLNCTSDAMYSLFTRMCWKTLDCV